MSSVFDTFTNLLGSTHLNEKSSSIDYATQREQARKRLYQGIEVRNRRYRFKEYKGCFVASEAVDFMVQSGWAPTREKAVELGQTLQKDFDLFQHVVEPERHLFADRYLFFKFNELNTNDNNDDDSDEPLVGGGSYRSSITSSMTDSLLTSTKKTGLFSVGRLLKQNINQKYNTKFDTEGFYAEEAVDYMVAVGLASSRNDAVKIGKALQGVGSFIQNCANLMEPFSDSRSFFFFSQDDDLSSSFLKSSSSSWKKDLEDARDFFRDNIKLVDHTYRLKTYKNTFTGKEAVDLFLTAGITSSRQDAVLLGRALMVEYNLFGHVVNEHEFEDSEFFYILGRKN
jgi:hypothetical protein